MANNLMGRMPAKDWAKMVYGELAPTPYALQRWIKDGRIHPAPKNIRGEWFVVPSAQYRDRRSNQLP